MHDSKLFSIKPKPYFERMQFCIDGEYWINELDNNEIWVEKNNLWTIVWSNSNIPPEFCNTGTNPPVITPPPVVTPTMAPIPSPTPAPTIPTVAPTIPTVAPTLAPVQNPTLAPALSPTSAPEGCYSKIIRTAFLMDTILLI